MVDPMSGIEIFRVGGNRGAQLLIDGVTDSGLVFPRILRNENLPNMDKVWNADGSLLMIDRRFERSGDPGNSASSYIIDVHGAYGAGAPWRILRASGSSGLGDGVGRYWIWDPNNPLRAFVLRDNGNVDEWWPVGGQDHSVGEVNHLFNIPSVARRSLGSFQGRRVQLQTSYDGRYYVAGCRETTGSERWGGIRVDLIAGEAAGPFIPTPDTDLPQDAFRTTQGTSAIGLYTYFARRGNRHRFFNTATGVLVSDTLSVDGAGISHVDFTIVNGREYLVGMRDSKTGWRMFDVANSSYLLKGKFPGANPQHTNTRASLDRFEMHGAREGATGVRYAIWTRSGPRGGHPRAILGVRMGPHDEDVVRYICNHRSVRADNANEVHPQITRDARFIVFNSNWAEPSGHDDGQCHPYVIPLPAAWYSPSNDGS